MYTFCYPNQFNLPVNKLNALQGRVYALCEHVHGSVTRQAGKLQKALEAIQEKDTSLQRAKLKKILDDLKTKEHIASVLTHIETAWQTENLPKLENAPAASSCIQQLQEALAAIQEEDTAEHYDELNKILDEIKKYSTRSSTQIEIVRQNKDLPELKDILAVSFYANELRKAFEEIEIENTVQHHEKLKKILDDIEAKNIGKVEDTNTDFITQTSEALYMLFSVMGSLSLGSVLVLVGMVSIALEVLIAWSHIVIPFVVVMLSLAVFGFTMADRQGNKITRRFFEYERKVGINTAFNGIVEKLSNKESSSVELEFARLCQLPVEVEWYALLGLERDKFKEYLAQKNPKLAEIQKHYLWLQAEKNYACLIKKFEVMDDEDPQKIAVENAIRQARKKLSPNSEGLFNMA